MRRRSIREVVEVLDQINIDDPEKAHSLADDLILEQLDPRIRDAYVRLMKRMSWWAAA